jgi:hypothetical protein
MAPAPNARQVHDALDRLRILGPAQAIHDPALGQALAPFRGQPPTVLLCANLSCSRPFLWCALDPLTARVRFSRAAPSADASPRPGRPPPFDRWDFDDAAGESIAPPGEPMLRWRFFCRRCDQVNVLTNSRMISLIVRALAAGRDEVRPASDEWERR